jgi:hypothetical protein
MPLSGRQHRAYRLKELPLLLTSNEHDLRANDVAFIIKREVVVKTSSIPWRNTMGSPPPAAALPTLNIDTARARTAINAKDWNLLFVFVAMSSSPIFI